jgi:hypothetical protein
LVALLNLQGYRSECSGIPHLAKNERDTRISCTQPHPVRFSEENRMKFFRPHQAQLEIRGYGAPWFVVGQDS